ncbi:MAG TPA: PAS domain S-box protein, partial [Terriglobales bacterium]
RHRLLKEKLQRGAPTLHQGEEFAAFAQDLPPSFPPGNAYLGQLVESAPEAVSILDAQRRVLRISSEFTHLFGYAPAEALGQSIDDLITPPDRQSESRWLQEVLARGQKTSLETRRRRKDGRVVEVFVSAAPVVVDGAQVASYVLYRDISEQKRAEGLSSALYRIAERTSATKDLAQLCIALHGIVAELVYARNFYIAICDEPNQTLSFPYFVDEKHATLTQQKLGRGRTEYVLRTGESLLCTPEVLRDLVQRGEVETGDRPAIDWLGVPLKSGDHTFGVVAIQSYTPAIRLTESDKSTLSFVSQQLASAIDYKRNEEALRLSETRHRSLVESAVYGIYRANLEGRFLDVNPALVTMLGYDSAEELLALDPKQDVFFDLTQHARLMRQFRRGARVTNAEARWKRRDGRSILVRLSGCPMNPLPGGGPSAEVIAEDVTERRVLEDQFRQAQKMEAVGRLAAGVAHDFNNLLTVIKGHTEVLLEHSATDSLLVSRIEAIQEAATRATSLTRQLLAFSRKRLLELKAVNLNTIVTDLERLLRPLLGGNVELRLKLAPELGHTRADVAQMEQVIMNLVVNSKDAMPTGGKITVATANVDLGDEIRRQHSYILPGSYVMLSVADTGQGMDQETQAQIFEPFFTTKEQGKGTGLGLSTVYGIIKQSRGYILVESAPEQGANFRIYLPRVEDVAEPLKMAPPAAAASAGSETILLVEDEESVRQLVLETLQLRGYKILEAAEPEAALRIASSHSGRIDLLITDVVMPGTNGRELSRQITSLRPDT